MATQGTGGYGLTLTESHRVFFYSENWRYALRLQAEDRCHRIGQKSNVYYTTLQGESRFDERIRSALTRKADALEELKNGSQETEWQQERHKEIDGAGGMRHWLGMDVFSAARLRLEEALTLLSGYMFLFPVERIPGSSSSSHWISP